MKPQEPNAAHWSDHDLLQRLYGLDPRPGLTAEHIEHCEACHSRWTALGQRRRVLLATPAVSEARLRAQRLALYARIEKPPRLALWGLVPAAATAMLLFFGVAFHTTAPPAAHPTTTAAAAISPSDRELLSEVAAALNDEAPRAADPIRGLFTDDSSTEVQ
jgi:hypothetical protein